MRTVLTSMVLVVVTASPALAAPPTLDSLMCRGATEWDANESYAALAGTPRQMIMGTDDVASPDGSMTLSAQPQDAKTNRGALLVKSKDGKTLHKMAPLDADYGCGTGRWLTNDIILATGGYCMEFGVKPYLANAKTGKQIAPFVSKAFDADPETLVHGVALDGTSWAFAVYNHSDKVNTAFIIDIATGKVTKKVDVTPAMVQKLPACAK
jgi:hypothetical protein|nr:hypothetical protein [Kofleriaceae bacterium]